MGWVTFGGGLIPYIILSNTADTTYDTTSRTSTPCLSYVRAAPNAHTRRARQSPQHRVVATMFRN